MKKFCAGPALRLQHVGNATSCAPDSTQHELCDWTHYYSHTLFLNGGHVLHTHHTHTNLTNFKILRSSKHIYVEKKCTKYIDVIMSSCLR